MEILETALGIGLKDLNWWQMSARAIIVFFVSLMYVRLANKRIFGRHSAFDIVLGVMYGSVMSRAITGNSPFVPTLIAGLVLILLHRFLATLAFRTGDEVSTMIKGKTVTLIKDGEFLKDVMRAHNVTENDIFESMRAQGSPEDISKVSTACLERSGSISVVMKDDK
ncbi:DUF421 domain-containing protein [Rufibacter tibetensis]|uniref:YetF C-terminal domain-containing protein n=1 Tax=Rufibacter tibetensis TaxID=512763 RepID=A0A0P0CPE2_9BACT|nr:YetF domain-containing protein [Rufibacter tibetensis]ALI99135.1 hypothetical protein DC20_09310 [Rufibacter tibetensis]